MAKNFIDLLVKNDTGDGCRDLIYLPSYFEYKQSDVCDGATDYSTVCGHSKTAVYKERLIALRDPEKYYNQVHCTGGDINYVDPDETQLLLSPALQLDLAAFDEENRDLLGLYEINGKTRPTIKFAKLVFPKTLVEQSDQLEKTFLEHNEYFKPTGKTYSGYRKADNTLEQNIEYEFNGMLFVRAKAKPTRQAKFFSQSRSACENDKYYWFEVEPIKFNIENWKQLPKTINPKGTGDAMTMQLHSSFNLLSGIPFYPTKTDCQWQNSIIRAYFNGYDIWQQLEKGNGMKDRAARINFDFSGKGFLQEMLNSNYFEKQEVEVKQETKPKNKKNPFNVTINEAPLSVKEQMKFYINEGKSFMLHGPSGVGKTRRVQELDPDCVCVQLRNGILPEEIIGKTGFENGKSVWIEPTWYTRICKVCNDDPDHNHVLFIDEITNVNANEQSLVFHLVLSRSIDGNSGKLPPNCVVVAAGNTPEESIAAYNMPEPLFRRFEAHIQLQPDIKSFLEWGSELREDGNPKIHPLVAAFVAANEKKVFYTKYDPEKPPKFAIDPRGWEQVSGIIYANKGELRIKMLADKIGEDNALALIKFAKTPHISIDEILEGEFSLNDLPKSEAEKYMLVCALRQADEKQVGKVRKFIKKHLGRENLEVFDSLWIEDDDERAILINQLDEEEKAEIERKLKEEKERKKEEENKQKAMDPMSKEYLKKELEMFEKFLDSDFFKNYF